MDGNPNVLRLLVREQTMSEAELEGAIKCLRVAARTASVGMCDVQLELDVCAADGTAATSEHTSTNKKHGPSSREVNIAWNPVLWKHEPSGSP
jgi:hypothetical protein